MNRSTHPLKRNTDINRSSSTSTEPREHTRSPVPNLPPPTSHLDTSIPFSVKSITATRRARTRTRTRARRARRTRLRAASMPPTATVLLRLHPFASAEKCQRTPEADPQILRE
ncbi:uncharacterized protein BO66DRAFT_253954 [Aspergillus aculeatinus CBS 121060]|uniref:Uncharacterized protein n=1 Tax=Aspergillus aculeatinus CBS 121060 TaxID=1448322 RepID=A0ACD1HI10_9EURO|nr:hypothetical protein BO66DRAFT_253954 [Aspergillus aculeatinus CBS 121060]RAH73066.1 hypothetical protein BO66DRAFT_253954 [Aspergillus aculeatinus CBS 121060]